MGGGVLGGQTRDWICTRVAHFVSDVIVLDEQDGLRRFPTLLFLNVPILISFVRHHLRNLMLFSFSKSTSFPIPRFYNPVEVWIWANVITVSGWSLCAIFVTGWYRHRNPVTWPQSPSHRCWSGYLYLRRSGNYFRFRFFCRNFGPPAYATRLRTIVLVSLRASAGARGAPVQKPTRYNWRLATYVTFSVRIHYYLRSWTKI